jgi:hypothetical protein
MNKCLSLVHSMAISLLAVRMASAQAELPQARVVSLNAEPGQVLVLHLRPGYVTSVRVQEDVSSVVLGDPGLFKAEHSDAEPQLVFFKTTTPKAAQTNALIATRGGREIALSLVSQGSADRTEPIDYLLAFEHPHSSLIASAHATFLIGETKDIGTEDPTGKEPQPNVVRPAQQFLSVGRVQNPHWQGKTLQVAVGQPIEKMQEMTVAFALFNSSESTVEVLPPQIELAGTSTGKHHKTLKAEPIAIKDYWMSTRRLAPGARADGVVLFDRPSFKESREKLLLSVAQADAVDHPILVPLVFVAPAVGGAK